MKGNKELSITGKISLELPEFLSGYKKRTVPAEYILKSSVSQK